MKHFKARLLVLCSLMVLMAAALAPIAAEAQAYGPSCPTITIKCPGEVGVTLRGCLGRRSIFNPNVCIYDANCLNCK